MAARAPSSELSSPFASAMPYAASERRVGKYRIVSELGRGGTATVYLTVARGRGGVSKLVVLKALLPEFVGEPDVVSMFLDEARVAALLNHPNVVQTYEIGEEGGRNVIVMEYLEGQSLSRLTRRADLCQQPLPQVMHLAILTHVLEGLHYAHELTSYDGSPLSLVHRDISPQNVFVTYDGQVKILDFGIAKTATSSRETGLGLLKGKISYMAPEQMQSEPLDRRADVYAAGCMLWAAAAGKKLWKDVPETQILDHVASGRVPSPRTVNPNCPAELERITMKALAFHREERYPTAAAMQAELEAFLEPWGMPRPRELGALVSTLFANDRQVLKLNVEQQLAALSSETEPDIPPYDENDAADAPWLADTRRGPIDSNAAVSATPPPLPKRRSWRWLLGAGAMAAAGVALFVARAPAGLLAEFGGVNATPVRGPLKPAAHAARTPDGGRELDHLPPALIVSIPETYVADYGPAPEPEPAPVAFPNPPARRLPFKSNKGSSSEAAAAPTPAAPSAPASAGAVAPAPSPIQPERPRCQNPFYIDGGIKRLRPECY